MLLTARILDNVANANSFTYAERASCTQGDAPAIYFQLVDASQDRAEKGFVPAGRRFVPAAGATVQVLLDNIDNARKVTRFATQPFPLDPSIWMVQLLSTDTLLGTVSMRLTLTEGSNVTRGVLVNALGVESDDGLGRY